MCNTTTMAKKNTTALVVVQNEHKNNNNSKKQEEAGRCPICCIELVSKVIFDDDDVSEHLLQDEKNYSCSCEKVVLPLLKTRNEGGILSSAPSTSNLTRTILGNEDETSSSPTKDDYYPSGLSAADIFYAQLNAECLVEPKDTKGQEGCCEGTKHESAGEEAPRRIRERRAGKAERRCVSNNGGSSTIERCIGRTYSSSFPSSPKKKNLSKQRRRPASYSSSMRNNQKAPGDIEETEQHVLLHMHEAIQVMVMEGTLEGIVRCSTTTTSSSPP